MAQPGPIETYRRAVAASECDIFGHLNIAFYPERFAAASLDLLERTGSAAGWRTVALDTRYLAELRAGAGMVIRSFVLAAEGSLVRLAHEGVTPAGERTTLAEHVLASDEPRTGNLAPAAAAFPWDRFEPISLPAGEGPIMSARDRVADVDTGAAGLTLTGFVQRFSDACLFVLDAIGMTESYRRDANRGFATFETRLALDGPAPAAGEGVAVTSGIIAIGGSSLRMLHRMRATRDGRPLARFYQAGVHFDLAARRGVPWPAEFRARAAALRFATA